MRLSKRWLSGFVLLVAGCWTTEQSLKPPPHPEEYTVPPTEDSRFSTPIEYPKGALNNDLIKKNSSSDSQNPGARFGTGPGMGGMGRY
jgi:hypothetical protein